MPFYFYYFYYFSYKERKTRLKAAYLTCNAWSTCSWHDSDFLKSMSSLSRNWRRRQASVQPKRTFCSGWIGLLRMFVFTSFFKKNHSTSLHLLLQFNFGFRIMPHVALVSFSILSRGLFYPNRVQLWLVHFVYLGCWWRPALFPLLWQWRQQTISWFSNGRSRWVSAAFERERARARVRFALCQKYTS